MKAMIKRIIEWGRGAEWREAGIVLIVFYMFHVGLSMGYVADDWYFLPSISWDQVVGTRGPCDEDGDSAYFFRPAGMIVLKYILNADRFPAGGHLFSILIHCINCVLFYRIGLQLCGKNTSFLGALVWGGSPVMCEPVYWMSGMFAMIYMSFSLGYILCGLKEKFWGGMGCLTGAICSYEMGFVLGLLSFLIWRRKWVWFYGMTAGLLVLRWILIGGVGLYGEGFLADSMNPMNWLKTIGYYWKCLF